MPVFQGDNGATGCLRLETQLQFSEQVRVIGPIRTDLPSQQQPMRLPANRLAFRPPVLNLTGEQFKRSGGFALDDDAANDGRDTHFKVSSASAYALNASSAFAQCASNHSRMAPIPR